MKVKWGDKLGSDLREGQSEPRTISASVGSCTSGSLYNGTGHWRGDQDEGMSLEELEKVSATML